MKKYPGNDILLENMLYVIDKECPDETIKIASMLIEAANSDSIKYDAYRFMAYAYKEKGDIDSARAALEQIPDITFTRLSEKAAVLTGEEKWQSACLAEGVAVRMMINMKFRIAECYTERGETEKAVKEYKQAIGVLETLEAGKAWEWARNWCAEKIAALEENASRT